MTGAVLDLDRLLKLRLLVARFGEMDLAKWWNTKGQLGRLGSAALRRGLRRSAEGRAVPLPSPFSGTNDDVALLALGFARGEPSPLAVPYPRRADA
ncbi:BrxE family protein [Sorangium sp. So ce260]|uniref:BrxE family protein n=1 Tax=Sorangium sp. So ce260 TaxID=3133291 RepID=UPI003F5E0E0E